MSALHGGTVVSERAPEGVYVYQPHPVSREDGLLWSIGGLPSGMSREHATKIAAAINAILTPPAAPLAATVVCSASKHVDGKSHGWRFDGDDPYVICEWCGETRDALTDRRLR